MSSKIATAKLSYGIYLDTSSDLDDDDSNDLDAPLNFPWENGNPEKWFKIMAKYGLELIDTGDEHSSYPQILAASDSIWYAEEYPAVGIPIEELSYGHIGQLVIWSKKLMTFCDKYDIPQRDPQWYLSAYCK